MELGAFSVSLSVRDLGVSREFYESTSGTPRELAHQRTAPTSSLFHGMFSLLTFSPVGPGPSR